MTADPLGVMLPSNDGSSRMAAIEPRTAVPAALTISRSRRTAHFLRHYLEMCAPMCIGFAVGDLVYFWAAEL